LLFYFFGNASHKFHRACQTKNHFSKSVEYWPVRITKIGAKGNTYILSFSAAEPGLPGNYEG
tara:strand:+ start:208 stop:393 length:186 start_codon:yes stop_codon:yes gene_type:complete